MVERNGVHSEIMRQLRRYGAVLLALLFIALPAPAQQAAKPPVQPPAQQQAQKPAGATTRRDSARIAIFETALPDTPLRAPFTVDTAAVLRLGAPGATADTAGVVRLAVDATVLRSGTIVIADDSGSRVRFYSRYGAFTVAPGGRGSDSGKFLSMKAVDARGDTLVACCSPGLSLFTAAGKFLSVSPPFRGEYLGVMQNGRYLVRGTTSETAAFQGQKGLMKSLLVDTLFTVDTRGIFSGRIAVLPSRVHVGLFNPDPNPLGFSTTYLETPFEPESYYATARTGFYYTDGRTIEARLYSPAGILLRIVRLKTPVTPLTPAAADTYRQAVLRKYSVVETRRYIEWVLGQYVMPQTIPQVRALRVAADGRIWMREHAFPAPATATWHIFSAEGTYEGALQLPARWKVHQIEAEFVVVSQTSADGRSSAVTVHRIVGR